MMASTYSAVARRLPDRRASGSARRDVGTNTAFLALLGPALHPESLAAMASWRIGAFLALVVGILGAMTTVRHTRREEEAGRLELVGSLRVGRLAALTAGLLAALVSSPSTSFAVAIPCSGRARKVRWRSRSRTSCPASPGVAIAAVTVQLASVARTASSIAVSVLVARTRCGPRPTSQTRSRGCPG